MAPPPPYFSSPPTPPTSFSSLFSSPPIDEDSFPPSQIPSLSPSPSPSICTTASASSASSFSSSSSSSSSTHSYSRRPQERSPVAGRFKVIRRARPKGARPSNPNLEQLDTRLSENMPSVVFQGRESELRGSSYQDLERSIPDAPGHPNIPLTSPADEDDEAYLLFAKRRTKPDQRLKIYDLPSNITTLELYSCFSRYGNIEDVEIWEDDKQKGRRGPKWFDEPPLKGATIRFRPPPKGSLPTGRSEILVKGEEPHLVRLHLEHPRDTLTIESPVNRALRFPESFELPVQRLDFGFMVQETTMMSMFAVEASERGVWRKPLDILFQVDLSRKQLDIRFGLRFDASSGRKRRQEKYRMRIPFVALQSLYETTPDNQNGGSRSILIPLQYPPHVWRQLFDFSRSHKTDNPHWSEWDTWFRQTDIVENSEEFRMEPLAIRKKKPTIDIGRWTTYRLTFGQGSSLADDFNHMIRALRDFNIPMKHMPDFKLSEDKNLPVWDVIDRPTPLSEGSYLGHMLDDYNWASLTYPLRYQLEACISQGCVSEYNVSKEFIDKLVAIEEREPNLAVRILETVVDSGKRYYDPMEILDIKPERRFKAQIPKYCVETRKATITPTMIYYANPVVETSYRVIRHFFNHKDRFLRVQFTDEKLHGKISATELDTSHELFTRVSKALTNGIKIGDRHFQFLAFGNSQLRQHGAYFFADGPDLTCEDIRKWMGKFEKIKVVAKFSARLGQCFSTTRAMNGFKVKDTTIPDVERNGFCFTDGCGTISSSAAQLIAAEYRIPRESPLPCAFQFRLGGCKGVLVVDPNIKKVETGEAGFQVCIRPSQRKFDADHNSLEIIRYSDFSVATLNRQLIQVLSDLGLEDTVFLDKLHSQLRDLNLAMEDKEAARKILMKNIDANGGTIQIAGLLSDGFMTSQEPFVQCLLHLWRAWSIKMLKEKARITIENGCFLLGVVDETGILKGHFDKEHEELKQSRANGEALRCDLLPEIFVQIPDYENKGHYKTIQGPCLLARNPSLHPGDLRVVNAVDCPDLRHLKNVVVFPQTGDKPIANMCSGGDLDGDDYIVIWDGTFIPPKVNESPMDYTPPKPVEAKSGNVTLEDIRKFFVRYMKNDTLGAIANAHLATADRLPSGVFSQECVELAGLHSLAVDFPKTGVDAKMRKELRIRNWPHFFEKHIGTKKKFYVSSEILGQLYDAVEKVAFRPEECAKDLKFDGRILTAFNDINEKHLNMARDLKAKYDAAIRRLMAQNDIKTEFEIWSTFALSHALVGSDYKFHEDMKEMRDGLMDRFDQEIRVEIRTEDEYTLGRFVAAIYQITNEEYTRAVENGESMPLISFPWVHDELLGKIAMSQGVFTRDPDTGFCKEPRPEYALPYRRRFWGGPQGSGKPKVNGGEKRKGTNRVIVKDQRDNDEGKAKEERKNEIEDTGGNSWGAGLPPMVTFDKLSLEDMLAKKPAPQLPESGSNFEGDEDD
ncbi:hypothetical protein TWF788_000370 [Orbilia oligospora]|uniref:RNA-dependent RNA polymerase n=1 Tax=Orbilia oligospora TaxID=2813651 RepID=A0A7C8Q1G0_ORBOL|nr:hypothetical protein TWF788_000370 [Orbilia oligospora]